jgi:uncharacterized membrane protein YdcZ (DUF606 family)
MKYFWIFLNSIAMVLAFTGGYASLAPDRLSHTNPDPFVCLAILLGVPVFSILSVAYSLRRSKREPLSRPSWSRNPFNWWGDPLQSLFVFTCIMGATALGSAFQRPPFGSVGFWTLGVYSSFTIGLLAGQILVYRIYRQRIASS